MIEKFYGGLNEIPWFGSGLCEVLDGYYKKDVHHQTEVTQQSVHEA